MATYTKPIAAPRWADNGGDRVEPTSGKKDIGWIFEEAPPYSVMNWLQGVAGDWLLWVDERLDDGATADDLRIAAGFDLEINDPDFYLKVLSDVPQIVFDADGGIDRLYYDRATDKFNFDFNGTVSAVLEATKATLTGALQIGSGTAAASAGAGVFSRGIAVGFDFDPLDDRIYIGNQDFIITGDPSFPQIQWDAGDLLFYARGDDSFNFRIGGVNKGAFLADAAYWNRWVPREYIEVPTNVDEQAARHFGNCVVACGTFIAQGGTSPPQLVSTRHFNINGNMLYDGSTGTWLVNLDQPVNSGSVLIAQSGNTGFVCVGVSVTSTQYRIYTRAISTGNATNPAAGARIFIALIGSPVGAPSPF